MSDEAKELPSFKELLLDLTEGVLTITFNRPKRKNAFNGDMYDGLAKAMNWAATDDRVVLVVLTGAGSFYSSGNDLSTLMNAGKSSGGGGGGGMKAMSRLAGKRLRYFTDAWLSFPKPLIAAVNGPAIGVACTTLALCDVVYCTESAYFSTPFASLGQSPEGVSSYMFPRLMGVSKANEVLMFGKQLTAHEAERRNLVSAVLPDHGFREEMARVAREYAQLPRRTLMAIKSINRAADQKKLREVAEAEIELLEELWVGEDCANAVMSFFMKQQAKKQRKKARSKL